MKLILPEIVISSNQGFDREIDIFERKQFGERLANLIENASDNPVIAIDASWGEGKTTFIKMWRGFVEHEREDKLKTIYFDAFRNDYQKDPFLALASEIYSLLDDKDEVKKKKFRVKATGAIKALIRGAIKISVNTATAGIVNGWTIDKAEKEISNLIASQVDHIIEDRFKNIETDRLALEYFRRYLKEFAGEVGNNKPIVCKR